MDLNHHVKFVIDLTSCPVHNQKPEINIEDNHVNFKCCCIDFKITCLRRLIKLFESDEDHRKKYGMQKDY
jgi:hypothetical protein